MSNFKKLAQEAKKLQQFYVGNFQSSEGLFKFTYRLLNGIDGMWVFKGNFSAESATSQGLLIDHRSACASLVSLEDDSGDILNPVEIVKILFSEEQLENVENLLEKFNDNEIEKISYKILWDASKNVKTIPDFLALGSSNKEIVWELLHLGFRLTFDTDFNIQFGYTWATAYKELKPNPAVLAMTTQIEQIRKSLIEPADVKE